MTGVDWKKLSWWVGGLVLLAALAAPQIAAAQHSMSATIGESFEFNGQAFEPGPVTIREVSHYNPGTTLNEIWISKRCLGLMLAEVAATASGAAGDDRLILSRSANGRLVLVGFAYRDQPPREFYRYETAATGGRWSSPSALAAERVALSKN